MAYCGSIATLIATLGAGVGLGALTPSEQHIVLLNRHDIEAARVRRGDT
jgi:hypothetical protein